MVAARRGSSGMGIYTVSTTMTFIAGVRAAGCMACTVDGRAGGGRLGRHGTGIRRPCIPSRILTSRPWRSPPESRSLRPRRQACRRLRAGIGITAATRAGTIPTSPNVAAHGNGYRQRHKAGASLLSLGRRPLKGSSNGIASAAFVPSSEWRSPKRLTQIFPCLLPANKGLNKHPIQIRVICCPCHERAVTKVLNNLA